MLHHSLCSAIGIPHSMQMRTRWRGSVLREKSRFRKDMSSPVLLLPETEERVRRFAESSENDGFEGRKDG
jgi:hypothetical protein